MIQIRRDIFETNSSSTHAIIICPESDYERLGRGEIMITGYESGCGSGGFIDRSTAVRILRERYGEENPDTASFLGEYGVNSLEECSEDVIDDMLADAEIAYTLDKYGENLETYEEFYTTEHGDKIVAFGYFGNDW